MMRNKGYIILLSRCTIVCILILSLSGCVKENTTPPRKDCEVNGTGIIKFVNKSGYTLKIELDGLVYPGMGFLGDDEEVSAEVTAGMWHTYKATTVSGAGITWNNNVTVATCKTNAIQLVK